MTSLPPATGMSGAVGIRVDGTQFRARANDETSVCFAVENAPPGRSRSLPEPDGGMTLLTEVRGKVVRSGREALEVDDGGQLVRVRHLLPAGIELAGLERQHIQLQVRQLFHPARPPTIDARMAFAPDGGLLMWARDGTLPGDGTIAEGAVRISCPPHGSSRLAVAWEGVLTSAAAGEIGKLTTGAGRLMLLPLRVEGDDVAFVLARG